MQKGQHPNCFYRVIVKVVIKDSDDNVLLVKENSNDWDLPGGGVDHGETVEQALKRELNEEINYRGDFTAEFLGSQPIYSKRADACMMFLVYSVTLNRQYLPQKGGDTTEVAFRPLPSAPEQFVTRSDELIYKFAVDQNYQMKFLPEE